MPEAPPAREREAPGLPRRVYVWSDDVREAQCALNGSRTNKAAKLRLSEGRGLGSVEVRCHCFSICDVTRLFEVEANPRDSRPTRAFLNDGVIAIMRADDADLEPHNLLSVAVRGDLEGRERAG